MVEHLLKTYDTVFSMLHWNITTESITVSSIDVYWLIYIAIKLHQSNHTRSTTFLLCFYSMTCNTCISIIHV